MSKGFPSFVQALEKYHGRFEAHKLEASNCEILFASYPKNTKIEPHSHETHNWGVITKGKMNITVDGQTISYRPGDWYEVPKGKEHSAYCDEETEEIEFWFRQD